MYKARDWHSLAPLFVPRISFGTAGLRAAMRPGYAQMNDVVVLQTSQGLAAYIERHVDDAKQRGVVIGHDHRAAANGLRSDMFAKLVRNVFANRGWNVYMFDQLVHTPMVPFAVAKLNAAAGVMITASHNPAQDNGYKACRHLKTQVYWGNAVQIVPPHDAGIAQAILQSLEIDESLWNTSNNATQWQGTQAMIDAYFEMVSLMAQNKLANSQSDLKVTYTAMHGVGLPFAQRAFETFGFRPEQFLVVEEQAKPDPTFSTVKFPNPEEKGALDFALAHADKHGSTLVVANDPDADRFNCAEKTEAKGWQIFTGDQIGAMLGARALQKYKSAGKDTKRLAMCASTVSSKMLQAMAQQEGFVFRETLTGFKFLGNEALKLVEQGYETIFEYEEAIGYAHGELRDKDGVTALANFCEMAGDLKAQGQTVSHYLDSLYAKYGFFASSNSYFICRDPKITNRIFNKLRFDSSSDLQILSNLKDYEYRLRLPIQLGGYDVTYIRDLTVGYDSSNGPTFEPDLPVDKHAHMISFAVGDRDQGDGVQVTGTIRTSGTEPKIKFYLEGSGHNRQAVFDKLAHIRQALGNEWLRWQENQLEKP
ncbi:hypothetical protein OIO90_001754 [Microbotryomycetes sp. JL221]|nr:hypothetical protein OIO90_001754 [Microbotryomycetes sp. JL221]